MKCEHKNTFRDECEDCIWCEDCDSLIQECWVIRRANEA
jgi:hypothetical protein